MSKDERTWQWRYALVLILLTTAPYVLAYSTAGEAWRFTGFLFAVEDGNSYIAKMMLGTYGNWLFRTPYSTASQAGVIAFLPFMLLGKLAGGVGLHEQLVALYHLFRVASIVLVVGATYRFAALFLEKPKARRWVTVMATLGAGVDWIMLLLALGGTGTTTPLSLYSPETFGFLAIYGMPHLVLARAMLLFALADYLQAADEARRSRRAGLTLVALLLVQPLSVVTAYAVIGAHQIALLGRFWGRIGWDRLKAWWGAALRTTLPVLPLVLAYAAAFSSDPFLRQWTLQNRILSPPIWHYLVAFALVLPLAVAGAFRALRKSDVRPLLVVAWLLAFPLLAYAPHNLQRRLPEGIWVALLVLAAMALSGVRTRPAKWRWVPLAILALSLPTTALLLGSGITIALRPGEPAYRAAPEVEAFQWLAENAEPGQVVLSSFGVGNALPAWAAVRVVVGHGPETVGLAKLMPRVESFFAGEGAEWSRRRFLAEHDVAYVFWGPHEREMGAWDPADPGFLRLVYAGEDVMLYAVPQEARLGGGG